MRLTAVVSYTNVDADVMPPPVSALVSLQTAPGLLRSSAARVAPLLRAMETAAATALGEGLVVDGLCFRAVKTRPHGALAGTFREDDMEKQTGHSSFIAINPPARTPERLARRIFPVTQRRLSWLPVRNNALAAGPHCVVFQVRLGSSLLPMHHES